ncbi:hypothetical protein DXB65_07865 [Bacteroides oleiciplenus]|uniref:Uncharacterized protein n=1 Tax=Bacteroides oleiciplenus TaxID=626931 RepID=A0A3E5BIK1_9BACE|nr:hypothetical protein DXB65_07865 [Bacteroides oleiciplenus]
MPEVLTLKIDKKMSDKLYCPKCDEEKEFIIKQVTLEVEGQPSEFAQTIQVICCSKCKLPIGSYTDNYYTEEEENTNS